MTVDELVDLVLAEAEAAISARGRFDIVLPGGDTPRALFAALASCAANWAAWHVYLSDERCVLAADPERNDVHVRELLLDRLEPPVAAFVAPAADEDTTEATARFASVLATAPTFDVAVLGLGDDGHTASLFPGGPGGADSDAAAVVVDDAPKPPPRRISMSAARLDDTRLVVFLVRAGTKRWARQRLRTGAAIPANDIRGERRILVELDIAPDHSVDRLRR